MSTQEKEHTLIDGGLNGHVPPENQRTAVILSSSAAITVPPNETNALVEGNFASQ